MASSVAPEGIRAGLASVAGPEASQPSATAHEIVTPSGRRISRENRRGFGNQGQKLAYPKREGYFRYWFNDTPGRVDGAKESGYTHVIDPSTGKNAQTVVGVQPNGDPLYAYLLEIPQEWRDDDAAALEEKNSANEEAIKSGPQPQNGKDAGNFYAQAQGRKLTIGRGPLR